MIFIDKFCDIAHSVTGTSEINFQREKCPDQWVGRLTNFGDLDNDFEHRQPATQCKKSSPRVVLILESPHIQEFIGNPGPAKGSTGAQIRRFITEILLELGGSLSSELILVNAIQFQCSLGVNTRLHRDKVFRRLWQEGSRNDFEERLSQVYNFGDLLLNCCTGGKKKSSLRHLVTASIHNSLGVVPLHLGPHPSSWWSPRNRKSVRLVTA